MTTIHELPRRPGARVLVLAPGEPTGPPEAFLIEREFTHLHPAPRDDRELSVIETLIRASRDFAGSR